MVISDGLTYDLPGLSQLIQVARAHADEMTFRQTEQSCTNSDIYVYI